MILDTNILIAYLSKEAAVVDQLTEWRQESKILLLPSLVEAEILSFSKLLPKEIKTIQNFLEENFIFISCDRSIARGAAAFRRVTKVGIADAIIAATAAHFRIPLVTRNVRDFYRLPIEVVNI